MPGTIQVSVLDLMDLPTSSSSSLVSVKVAMGKREYQTWDKGEFLFPLMTLRDNLIVTLLDAEGKEISRTDVKTMSVVEKGVWDNLFPLKGGGWVHMKLQFILNEEERKRVHDMRKSAVEKKEELIKKSLMHSEIVTDTVVSDSQESIVQTKDANVIEETIKDLILNPIVGSEKSQPNHALQDSQSDQTAPDRSGDSSTTPFLEVQDNTEHSREHNDCNSIDAKYSGSKETYKTQSPATAAPQRHISSKEALDPPLSEENTETHTLASNILGKGTTPISQTEISAEKIPSNVRKMISTFESSLLQGPRPRAIRLTKSQSNMIEMGSSFKSIVLEESSKEKSKFIQQDKETRGNSFPVTSLQEVNLQESAKNIRSLYAKEPVDNVPRKQEFLVFDIKKGSCIVPTLKENKAFEEKIVLETCREGRHGASKGDPVDLNREQLDMLGAKLHPVKEINPSRDRTNQVHEAPRCIEDDTFQSCQDKHIEAVHKKETGKELLAFWDNLGEAAEVEKVRPTGIDWPAYRDLKSTQQESDDNVVLEKCGCKTCRKDYNKPTTNEASKVKQKLVIYDKAEHCLLESPGSWIFQDEARHLCMTTAGKKMRNMVGGCGINARTHPSEMTADGTVESKICTHTHDIDKHDGASSNFRNLKAESSTGVPKNGGGLIEQAIRVAIIAACATIFYSSRQRKTR